MSGFSVVKKGYDSKEVDEYITKNNMYLEDKLKEQKLRINELKNQNLKLAVKIKEMKGREDDVKNALIAANEKSKEIMSAVKIKYALEGQRIRLLQAKWTSYFESGMKKYDNDDYKKCQAHYIKAETEIREILKNDFGIITEKALPSANDEILTQYRNETERLFGSGGEREIYGEIIKNIKKELGGECSAETDAIDGEEPDGDITDYELPYGIKSISNGYRSAPSVAAPEKAEPAERRDFTNLASVKPEQSLEELCRELGL
ncbi:MAG: DivIVA domain-containing protein [Clostridiales bacterium]|jgi:cell division septum initiation protein DivIVA|nr:DivIVA domain-containing protein [Clostridiales bacterium]